MLKTLLGWFRWGKKPAPTLPVDDTGASDDTAVFRFPHAAPASLFRHPRPVLNECRACTGPRASGGVLLSDQPRCMTCNRVLDSVPTGRRCYVEIAPTEPNVTIASATIVGTDADSLCAIVADGSSEWASIGPVTTVGPEPTSLDDTVPFIPRPRTGPPASSPAAPSVAGGFLSPSDME